MTVLAYNSTEISAVHRRGLCGRHGDEAIGTVAGSACSIALFKGTLERTVVDDHGVIGNSLEPIAFACTDTTFCLRGSNIAPMPRRYSAPPCTPPRLAPRPAPA